MNTFKYFTLECFIIEKRYLTMLNVKGTKFLIMHINKILNFYLSLKKYSLF